MSYKPKQQHRYGWGWRKKGRVLQKYVTEEMDIGYMCNVDTFCTMIKEAASKLEEACVSLETHDGEYGDRDRDYLAVRGWRAADPDEIRDAEQAFTDREESAARWEASEIERLRKVRPELFKEET